MVRRAHQSAGTNLSKLIYARSYLTEVSPFYRGRVGM